MGSNFEQMRHDWWIRRAILHLFHQKCFPVITCIPCDQLKEAEELFPVQYFQATEIHKQTQREKEIRNGIQPG
jgi:hypothetical protein